MPRGIYRITSQPLTHSAIVGACVPESYALLAHNRGYLSSGGCPSGVRPVMKYVAAVPGDSVEIRWHGVFVNGKPIPNTDVLAADSFGRGLPNYLGNYLVQQGQYWLIANHDRGSFDSRYFGPVTEILGVAEPLITEAHLCGIAFLRQFLRC